MLAQNEASVDLLTHHERMGDMLTQYMQMGDMLAQYIQSGDMTMYNESIEERALWNTDDDVMFEEDGNLPTSH